MNENTCGHKECVYYNENATENCMAPDYEDMLFAKCIFVTKRSLQPDPREAAIRELCDAGKEVIEQVIDFDCGCDECTQIRDRFIAALAAVGGKA
jgi:hypothetical protein